MARIGKPVEREFDSNGADDWSERPKRLRFFRTVALAEARMPLDRAGKTLILKKSAGALELR